ncbi:sensor domain-containing diguanylate cyclase [Nakamurella lactea]|uniref:sensor domain-containing diguanylate cyclase n=1 Tax=Nakamurella lactea TaxID=459515 RepID=UPI0012B65212|nr:GGDEF domain-containing protein [Nakamurella lactea]
MSAAVGDVVGAADGDAAGEAAGDAAGHAGGDAGRLADLALRAAVHGHSAVAVDRLIDAERAVRVAPVGWRVRRTLARSYRHLRMYELAVPHLQRAPIGHRHELAELHLIWADELDQVAGADGWSGRRGDRSSRDAAAAHRRRAELHLTTMRDRQDDPPLVAALMDECRIAADPAAVDTISDHPEAGLLPGARVRGYAARCRAMVRLGRLPEALWHGRRAIELAGQTPEDRTTARSGHYALHCAELAAASPGAVVADPLVTAAARRLWLERSHAMDAAGLRRDSALLDAQREAAERLAAVDPLTSLANRETLSSWLAQRPAGPMSIVMVDLTAFKTVNDTFGHPVGDQVLVRVANALAIAASDSLVCRFGGDEFVVANDRDDHRVATTVLAIRRALSELDLGDLLGGPLPGCEIGWAVGRLGGPTGGLLAEADRRLLEAKRRRSR